MAQRKANPKAQLVLGTILGSVLMARGLEFADSALAGLTGPDLGALNLTGVNYKEAGLNVAVVAAGFVGANKSTNQMVVGVAAGAAAAAANRLTTQAMNVFTGGGMSGLGAVANNDLYENDGPISTGMRGPEEYASQFAGAETDLFA